MPLTPLQQRVAGLVADELDGTGYLLVGGAALIVLNVTQRKTMDLDFFGPPDSHPAEVAERARRRLEAEGFEVRITRVTDYFGRLRVEDGDSWTDVDFGLDTQIYPAVDSELGPVLSEREAGVNKLLAVFNRTEPRDLADLSVLLESFTLEELADDAPKKDKGFDLRYLRDWIDRFRLRPAEFYANEAQYKEVQTRIKELNNQLDALIRKRNRGPEIDL